jgi:predicted nucleic acid-binding protein
VILVDTTIWIDFFAYRNTKQVITLIHLIQENQDLCICGVILTEILQGIKNPREHQQVENHLAPLKFLDMTKSTFLLAAEIYRTLRQHGFTVRKTIDCMIAAVAIENDVALLHHDRDFDPIEKHCGLYVVR